MVKKKSLFDDKPRDIEELTYLIKQDLLNLQNKIADLQRVNMLAGNSLVSINYRSASLIRQWSSIETEKILFKYFFRF